MPPRWVPERSTELVILLLVAQHRVRRPALIRDLVRLGKVAAMAPVCR